MVISISFAILLVRQRKFFPKVSPNLKFHTKFQVPQNNDSGEAERAEISLNVSVAVCDNVKKLLATSTFEKATYYELLSLAKLLKDENIAVQVNQLSTQVLKCYEQFQSKREQLAILNNKLSSLNEAYHNARYLEGRTYDHWLRFRLDNLLFLERCLPIFPTHGGARIAKNTRLHREQNADLIEQSISAMESLKAEIHRVKNFQEIYKIELGRTKSQILALFKEHQNLCKQQLTELRQVSKHHSLARVKTSMSTVQAQESLLKSLFNFCVPLVAYNHEATQSSPEI